MSNAYRVSFAIIALLAASTSYAATITYIGDLNGPAESPPNASPATGSTTVAYTASTHMLQVDCELFGPSRHDHGFTHPLLLRCGRNRHGGRCHQPTFSGFSAGRDLRCLHFKVSDLTMTSSFNPAFVTANGGDCAAGRRLRFLTVWRMGWHT